jgi:hypothetical protein
VVAEDSLVADSAAVEAARSELYVVRPERLELPTLCSEGRCSIQLSYGRPNAYYGKFKRSGNLPASLIRIHSYSISKLK